MNPGTPHGSFAYTGSNGALNAIPFSVQGTPVAKPPSDTNTFIASITGTPFIPHLTKPNPKQFVFLSVQGTRNTTPSITPEIVPVEAQRGGDFSQLASTIYAPSAGLSTACIAAGVTPGQPFPNNMIPAVCQSAAGQALLNYYPQPNITPTGAQNNYQTVTTVTTHSQQVSARYNRSFGQAPTRGRGGFGGGGFGGRGGAAEPQRSQGAAAEHRGETLPYSHRATATPSFVPQLGGTTSIEGYSLLSSYTIGYGRLTSTATLNWNRTHTLGANYFTNTAVNPAQTLQAGDGPATPLNVGGDPAIYGNPFYFGVPSVSLTQFSGLNDAPPSESVNQTISFTDFVAYRHGKHNLRVGGDIRRIHADSIGGSNVLGSFTFSGFATENPMQQTCVPSSTQTCTFAPSGRGDCRPAAGAAAADRGHGGTEQDLPAGECAGLVCAGRLPGDRM